MIQRNRFCCDTGLAFDEYGNRLGYGSGGYYDRFPAPASGVPLVALAFELQILDKIPVEPWDKQVDMIITEKRVIRSKKLC